MQNTKKVKHAGRFGSRYGKGIRDRVVAVEKIQRKKQECPRCGFKRVKRISTGLYKCSKCGFTFAGGAFLPTTMSGRIVKKMVSQRKFLPNVKDLIEAREKQLKETGEKNPVKQEEPKKKGKKANGKKAPAASEKKAGKKAAIGKSTETDSPVEFKPDEKKQESKELKPTPAGVKEGGGL